MDYLFSPLVVVICIIKPQYFCLSQVSVAYSGMNFPLVLKSPPLLWMVIDILDLSLQHPPPPLHIL